MYHPRVFRGDIAMTYTMNNAIKTLQKGWSDEDDGVGKKEARRPPRTGALKAGRRLRAGLDTATTVDNAAGGGSGTTIHRTRNVAADAAVESIDNADVYKYEQRIHRMKKRLLRTFDGSVGASFMELLVLSGVSKGRLCYYADRLVHILDEFGVIGVRVGDATIKDCQRVLSVFIERKYTGETKLAYALCLKRLVHFAKTGELGSKGGGSGRGYVTEAAWITPSAFRDRPATSSSIQRKDLLTPAEFGGIVSCTTNRRDRALLWVMYEGAFRPGELLNMRVGGVEFGDRYAVVSTTGKTGPKSTALVTSFRPLLEWLSEHPFPERTDAPLWYSPWRGGGGALGYTGLRAVLAKAVRKSGVKKPVWSYLLRHTRLTDLAKNMSDQTLRVVGNWAPGSKMVARYTHLGAEDGIQAVLRLHGIARNGGGGGGGTVHGRHASDGGWGGGGTAVATADRCGRCGEVVEPDAVVCGICGTRTRTGGATAAATLARKENEGVQTAVPGRGQNRRASGGGSGDGWLSPKEVEAPRSFTLEQKIDYIFDRMITSETTMMAAGGEASEKQGRDNAWRQAAAEAEVAVKPKRGPPAKGRWSRPDTVTGDGGADVADEGDGDSVPTTTDDDGVNAVFGNDL